MTQAVRALVAIPSSTNPMTLEALSNAIGAEVRLLEDLIGVMRKQRQAVAADDLQGIDDSVFATHRILVTLGEARRQRRSIGRLLGGTDDLGLRTLDDLLGEEMTDTLRDARDGLRAAALILAREVEMNRQILRSALSTGGELIRGLYGPSEAASTYGPNDQKLGDGEGRGTAIGGLLIDRQV